MSRKITQEVFLDRFKLRYPDAQIEILEYSSLKAPCKLKCMKCGAEFVRTRAESFLNAWPCCEARNESKIEMIKRFCEVDGHYQFIKQTDATHVIIKHLDCGTEAMRLVQSAVQAPCSCQECKTRSQKLRISIQDAQAQLKERFEDDLTLLFFDGVDSKKSQYRCNKCGLIFNQSHYNLLSKCRGCPKCDQRRSKGERAMRKYLDERGISYNEQVRVPELRRLAFDFEILDINGNRFGFIEVQGDQHYREVFRYKSRPNYYLTQQAHDEQKRQWCKEHGYPLYEIYNDCGALKGLDILSDLNSTTISAKESTP